MGVCVLTVCQFGGISSVAAAATFSVAITSTLQSSIRCIGLFSYYLFSFPRATISVFIRFLDQSVQGSQTQVWLYLLSEINE